MLRSMLSILPLWVQFQEALKGFREGLTLNTRDATKEFINRGAEVSTENGGNVEEASTSITTDFIDGSGMATTIVRYEDGTMAFSHTFLAASPEAMSAMLDVAAACFTEMDTKALAAGLSR